jgi:hypothetical protein
LEKLGFTSPPLFTSHRFSSTPVIINLVSKREEELLDSFRKKTRQYVRRALNSKLVLRTDVNSARFDEIYTLFIEHGELMGYRPRPYASLQLAWNWLVRSNYATFIQAWKEETLVGAILIVFTGRTAYYLAGAIRKGFTECRPAEFLHWHAIREAINRQMDTYDLVNLGTAGVAQFKAGFRPVYQSWHDPRTKVYRPVVARLIGLSESALRPLLRRIARHQASYHVKAQLRSHFHRHVK